MVRKVLLCSVVSAVALAVACGKSNPSPTSPSAGGTTSGTGAAADGSTLKATAPTTVSPVNGAQPDIIVLTANASKLSFGSGTLQYQFQIRSGSTVIYDSQAAGVSVLASGGTVTLQPTATLTPDATYTWRVRATMQSAAGPWSSDATFKAPVGGYIRGAELFDPLLAGRTVGTLVGGANLTANGVNLPNATSWVQYQLPETIQAGEFSMMITGLSTTTGERTHGAKASVAAMGEGFANITTNDYRATMDFRGRNYPDPGSITFRIITGDHVNRIFDGVRQQIGGWDPTRWYFWRFSWRTGRATLEVRQDGPEGGLVYTSSVGTGSHAYNPQPHVLYVGKPTPRGGEIDGTAWPITVKNVWASANPRPPFPG
jgi:hypothetical protein